jgi:hypothetical protein
MASLVGRLRTLTFLIALLEVAGLSAPLHTPRFKLVFIQQNRQFRVRRGCISSRRHSKTSHSISPRALVSNRAIGPRRPGHTKPFLLDPQTALAIHLNSALLANVQHLQADGPTAPVDDWKAVSTGLELDAGSDGNSRLDQDGTADLQPS